MVVAFSSPMAMIRRLMEYRASWVRMPARMPGIPILVCRIPVTAPAMPPAIKAPTRAMGAGTPLTIITAATAPPVHREPSTVRSGKSRIL